MAKAAKLPTKAQMEERAKRLERILYHMKSLNPINMHWDNYYDTGLWEKPEEGGRKILKYHGFNVATRVLCGQRENLTLEYDGKVVLELSHPIGYADKELKDVNIRTYESGAWEKAIDKVIEMGFQKAYESFIAPVEKARERQKAKELKEYQERVKRLDLEERANNLGF